MLALIGIEAAQAAAPTGPSQRPFTTKGHWITDKDGRVFLTTGVNIVKKKPPFEISASGFSDDDMRLLRDAGIDSVRLGVVWEAVEPRPGQYDDAYIADIRAMSDRLWSYGISSLVDFHQDMYSEKYQGNGHPAWANVDNGVPSWPQLGFPYNSIFNLGMMAAFDSFLRNAPGPGGVGLQDRYAAMAGHVAAAFKDAPGLFGYDLINEPLPGSQWPSCFDWQSRCANAVRGLGSLHNKTATAIRQASPTGIMMYEPIALVTIGAPALSEPPADANRALSFHSYCPLAQLIEADPNLGKGPLIQWLCGGFDEEVMRDSHAKAGRDGSAWLLSEWGVSSNVDLLTQHVDSAARWMVGQQYWEYTGLDSSPTAPPSERRDTVVSTAHFAPEGANLNAEKLGILATPHPRTVAGTPVRYGFNRGSRTFTLEYSTARADGAGSFPAGSVSMVTTPRRVYGAGYTVSVTGARVVSAANAPVLRVRSLPGAATVKVTITAR